MGKVKLCTVGLQGSKEVYRPGETVAGTTTLHIEGDLKVNGVDIYCVGMALTEWTSLSRRYDDPTSKEIYCNVVSHPVKGEPTQILTEGKHTYKFRFQLPREGIPSSFEGPMGCIRYWLRIEVDKPFPSINDKYYKGFTVLAHLDVNEHVYRRPASAKVSKVLSKALGIGNAGTLTLSASIDRTGYCPGEKISINLEAKNESTKDCGNVKATLVQRVEYTAGGESDSTTRNLRTLEANKLGKGQTTVWNQQLLLVDAIPPSTKQLTCQIIRVTYHVLIAVEVPLGTDLEMRIPVKIGTAPLGVPLSNQPELASPGYWVIQKSKTLNYVKCQLGIGKFGKSRDNFVNLNYTPCTVYVRNYNPAAATATTTTPAASAVPAVAGIPATSLPRRAASATPTQRRPLPTTASTSPASSKAAEAGVSQTVSPSAPPMPEVSVPTVLPPSYEEACRPVDASATTTTATAMPTPYFQPLQPGKGSILVLQFPVEDITAVRDCFRRTIPNMLLHDGKVIGYLPQIEFFPSTPTAGMLIHFGSERTALSWLQNLTSADPQLISKCWVLIGENKVNLGIPGDVRHFNAISLVILKRNAEFKPTKSYTEEYQKLLTESLRPLKVKHCGKTVLSGKAIFAGGDWSSFPAKASELTVTATQFPTSQHLEAYRKELGDDPQLVRYVELLKMAFTRLSSTPFLADDISIFQDL